MESRRAIYRRIRLERAVAAAKERKELTKTQRKHATTAKRFSTMQKTKIANKYRRKLATSISTTANAKKYFDRVVKVVNTPELITKKILNNKKIYQLIEKEFLSTNYEAMGAIHSVLGKIVGQYQYGETLRIFNDYYNEHQQELQGGTSYRARMFYKTVNVVKQAINYYKAKFGDYFEFKL